MKTSSRRPLLRARGFGRAARPRSARGFGSARSTASIRGIAGALVVAVFAMAGGVGCGSTRGGSAAGQRARASADLVVVGASVHPQASARERVEAMAIAGGRIVALGSRESVERFIGERSELLDLEGRIVLPAFHDAHVHPVTGGVELGECDLNGLETRDEIVAAIRRYVLEHPDDKWIRGGGWDLPAFPASGPRRELLDALVGDRPAFLTAMDAHSAWVSSAALARAGITAATSDPEGGRIERDAATGEPTGTLRESAMDLVARLLPEHADDDLSEGLRRALGEANRFGIVGLVEASADERILATYAELDRRGELTARVHASMRVDLARCVEQVGELIERRELYRGRRLDAGAVKIFLDGVIESGTAALLEPYVGRPDDRGEANASEEELIALVVALDRARFQIHVHAIGDRAVRMALDAFEAAREQNGERDSRHQIAHVELVSPDDIPRFGQLGVTANFQPLWAYADPYITELTEPVLGPERSRWLYPIASIARGGARIAFGSDWSVSSMNPLLGIEVAVTRIDPRIDSRETAPTPWIPEERVTLDAALASYTRESARLAFLDDESGTLEIGKAADFIVLDRDIFALPPSEIGSARVLRTFLDGEQVFSAEGR